MLFQQRALPEWSSDDAAQLKLFLESNVGQRALAHVLDEKPSLLDGSDVNKTLVASGNVRGFVLAIESLFRLTYEQPTQDKQADTDYPDLDDESKWKDGQPASETTTNRT